MNSVILKENFKHPYITDREIRKMEFWVLYCQVCIREFMAVQGFVKPAEILTTLSTLTIQQQLGNLVTIIIFLTTNALGHKRSHPISEKTKVRP